MLEDQLLPESLAAEFLGLSVHTLRHARVERRGPPFVKLGRTVRYSARALVDYIESNTRAPEDATRAA